MIWEITVIISLIIVPIIFITSIIPQLAYSASGCVIAPSTHSVAQRLRLASLGAVTATGPRRCLVCLQQRVTAASTGVTHVETQLR